MSKVSKYGENIFLKYSNFYEFWLIGVLASEAKLSCKPRYEGQGPPHPI